MFARLHVLVDLNIGKPTLAESGDLLGLKDSTWLASWESRQLWFWNGKINQFFNTSCSCTTFNSRRKQHGQILPPMLIIIEESQYDNTRDDHHEPVGDSHIQIDRSDDNQGVTSNHLNIRWWFVGINPRVIDDSVRYRSVHIVVNFR